MTSLITRDLEELTALERLGLISMSYSRLDNYGGCPARYFYTYVEKLPRTFGPAAALGNIVHAVLEHVGDELDLTDMHQLMDEHREIHDPDHQIQEPLMTAGWQMLSEYHDRHVGEPIHVLGHEEEFQVVIGSGLFTGYIDRVERRDQKVVVTDYKSGTWETRVKPRENLQLGLYALVCARRYQVEEVYAELYYLRSGRRPGHLFTLDDMASVEERILGIVRTIVDDRAFHPTKDVFVCRRLCDFGKQGVCPTGRGRV